jgi:phoR protein
VRRTLTFKLLATNVFLLAIVIAALSVTTVTMLRSYLMRTLDSELQTSGQAVAKQAVTEILTARQPAEDSKLNLSEYYVYTTLEKSPGNGLYRIEYDPRSRIAPSTRERYGQPKNPGKLVERLGGRGGTTVAGTQDGSKWRALRLNVYDHDGTYSGRLIIARPLAPIDKTVMEVAWLTGFASATIIVLGTCIAYLLIRSSLRPLRGIERATHTIADGDLSRRVPGGKDGSEVAMLADSINVMLSQIEQAFDAKERSEAKMRQFVSDASHELRTPLATVRGYAELYRIGGVKEGDVPQTMDRIESEAHRMGGLVEDLLQLARLDEGRPLTFADVCVTELCMNAVMDFRVRAGDRTVAVTGLDGPAAPEVTVTADEDKVTQVVTNLLSNVLTHTPAGTPVEVAIGRRGGEAVIEVRDHGPGVRPEDAEHLFERFYRADYSRSRASGGSGLGLAIVASVMAAHGGTARVAETPGGGLTVRLTFPANARAGEEAPTARGGAKAKAGRGKAERDDATRRNGTSGGAAAPGSQESPGGRQTPG